MYPTSLSALPVPDPAVFAMSPRADARPDPGAPRRDRAVPRADTESVQRRMRVCRQLTYDDHVVPNTPAR